MNELLVNNMSDMVKSEIDNAVATAKKYPRDIPAALKRAEVLINISEEVAQSCFYVLPRKDKDGNSKEITGPSIRLAEIMASQWHNLRIGARIISNDGRYVTVEGIVIDTESNNTYLSPIQLAIFGTNKKGEKYTYNENMQQTLTGAAVSKAKRNSIFQCITLALALPLMHIAMKVSVGDQKSLNTKRNEVFEKLLKMGIDKQKILDYFGKPLNEFTAEDVRTLIGAGVAIKEGHMKKEEAFSMDDANTQQMQSNTDEAKNRLGNLTNINSATGEIIEPMKVEPIKIGAFEQAKSLLLKAKTSDALDVAADTIRDVPEDQQEDLRNLYKVRQAAFNK